MTLLTKEVVVKWGARNKRHYTSLGYEFTKIGDTFKIPVEHLPSGSNVKVEVQCDYCNEVHRPRYIDFLIGRKRIEKDTCGDGVCRAMKRTEVNQGYYTTVADVPKLLEEWHDIEDPSRVLTGSDKKYRWKCSVCGGEWEARPNHRNRGSDCPHCAGYYSEPLKITHPELVEEWSDKNKLRPYEVTAGSRKAVIWECKTCSHEWKATPNSRTNMKSGCPHCAGKTEARFNRYSEPLSVTHSDLVEEWSSKNDLRPDEVTAGSHKAIIWECKSCSHKWKSRLTDRARGRGCPLCNESKGEKLVASILDELNVPYVREQSFPDLKGLRGWSLRYDFAILHEDSPIALIEYDGEQHFRAVEHFGGEARFKQQQLHDRLKDDYARKRNIPLLRIRYDQSEEEVKKIVSEFAQIQKEFEKAV